MANPATRQLPAAAPFRREWVVILAAAVGLALGLRLLVLDACRITSASMERTLLPGDRVLIDKLAYGAPAPGFLPPFRFPGLGSPQRGDVVLFAMDGARLVKRCLAVPGDTVEVRGDAVFVNGAEAMPPAAANSENGPARGPIIVPREQYFMVGDAREASHDSRHFGFVPGSDIIGRALVIYWSLDADGTPRRTIRWSRIGRMIP